MENGNDPKPARPILSTVALAVLGLVTLPIPGLDLISDIAVVFFIWWNWSRYLAAARAYEASEYSLPEAAPATRSATQTIAYDDGRESRTVRR
jgi:hypothetical protein